MVTRGVQNNLQYTLKMGVQQGTLELFVNSIQGIQSHRQILQNVLPNCH